MIPVGVVPMSIHQVINVTIVFDRRMAAIRAVFMRVIFVNVTAAHVGLLGVFVFVRVRQHQLHDVNK